MGETLGTLRGGRWDNRRLQPAVAVGTGWGKGWEATQRFPHQPPRAPTVLRGFGPQFRRRGLSPNVSSPSTGENQSKNQLNNTYTYQIFIDETLNSDTVATCTTEPTKARPTATSAKRKEDEYKPRMGGHGGVT